MTRNTIFVYICLTIHIIIMNMFIFVIRDVFKYSLYELKQNTLYKKSIIC